jgi:putative endonuclease
MESYMKYLVYILYSPSKDRYYIGQTQDIEDRMLRHNSGRSKSTKYGLPWILVYTKEFDSRSTAMLYEKKLKSEKSREYLEEMIKNTG